MRRRMIFEAAADLHLRPAATLVRAVNQFDADVVFEHEHRRANGKRILEVLMLGLKAGTLFTVLAEGREACKAIRAVKEIFTHRFFDKARKVDCSKEKRSPRGLKRGMGGDVVGETGEEGQPAKRRQTFTWPRAHGATEVWLAGDFNGWIPIPMTRSADGFTTSVALAPGEHQYKFIVDGNWRDDPAAAAFAPNAFGTMNSIIRVK